MLRARLADAFGLGVKQATLKPHASCSLGVVQAVWTSYTRWRAQAAPPLRAPLHQRVGDAYRVRIFRFGSLVVKEYTGDTRKVATELAVLSQLQHGSLVSYVFIADEGARLSVFMDWAGDSLGELFAGQQRQACSEGLAQSIMFQLVSAVASLHKQGILHRDIKPDNIAMQPDLTVRLFDWSEALLLRELAAMSDRQLARHAGVAGTPLWMPPEALLHVTACTHTGRGGSSSSSSPPACSKAARLRELTAPALDVWGLGTVAFFLLAGRDILAPDSGYSLQDMAERLSTPAGTQLPPHAAAAVSPAAADFLRACLHPDPSQRASTAQLLAHPWLAAYAVQGGGGGGWCASAGATAADAAADKVLVKAGGQLVSADSSPPASPGRQQFTIRTALY